MIQEAYCSYETSKLLKEKGFDFECIARYTKVGDFVEEEYKSNWNFQTTDCSAPTQQMAMRWLREIHHIHIRLINSSDELYRYEIYPREGKYRSSCFSDRCYYETYEKAAEAAIKFCLENLITE